MVQLVIMVRVGDCGPAGYNGPGWGLWSGQMLQWSGLGIVVRLVIMVRVGDCGPAGYNGPGWGLWSGWL